MKTPLCDACRREGSVAAICPDCRSRIARGEITALDAEVSQILFRINETHNISAARFSRALDMGRVVLLLTDGEAGLLIGREGRVVSAISSALGRKVRIVESTGDVRKSISDILTPARLLGINSAWVAGRERLRVRISKSDERTLPVDADTVRKVIGGWMGKEVELLFE